MVGDGARTFLEEWGRGVSADTQMQEHTPW